MDAQQHVGALVAQVVHQAVVQAAIAGAWRQGDELDIEGAQEGCDRVAAPQGAVAAWRVGAGFVVHPDVSNRAVMRLHGVGRGEPILLREAQENSMLRFGGTVPMLMVGTFPLRPMGRRGQGEVGTRSSQAQ